MASHMKKSCISVKENNASKNLRSCSYGSHFKVVVIKHAKQTTVKQQENTVSAMANGKWQKVETRETKPVNSM
jgi:hypothetical protein